MDQLTELFEKKVVVSCYCDERISMFRPTCEDDNEFWWCEIHNFQGVVFCNNQIHRVESIDEYTGEFIMY